VTLSNSAVVARARVLRGVRGELDDLVGSKADVVGSMVGLRRFFLMEGSRAHYRALAYPKPVLLVLPARIA